jgi:hypothetical protein
MKTLVIDMVIKRWPTRNAQRWFRQFLSDAAEDTNVVAVIAIGSAVRDSVDCDDLDIIAICRSKAAFDYRAPIEVDLRSFEATSVEEELESGDDLLGWSVRFGKVLFERNRYWTKVWERWCDRIRLPSAEVARARAETTEAQMQEMLKIGDQRAADELNLSRLTHLARAALSDAGVYPASRPELPSQLDEIEASLLAQDLRAALARRSQNQIAKEPAV